MKIAILSDIHDQKANLEKIINRLKEKEIAEAIVLGDYCAPPTVRTLVASGLRCRCIFGNNDGDAGQILEAAQSSEGRVTFSQGDFDQYEIDGQKVFVTHYPEIARPVAQSGQFNAVFYGHNHELFQEKLDNGCLLLNPGEVWGWLKGAISYAIWDTQTNTAEIINLGANKP